MKTSNSRPDQTLFLNLTTAIVLLPVLAFFVSAVWMPYRFSVLWSGQAAPWQQFVYITFGIAVPLSALLVTLWKGSIRLPLVLLFLAGAGMEFGHVFDSPHEVQSVDLKFGQYNRPGIDVFCNGEHLGKTPFTISDKEFRKKVSPWTAPPRQDRLKLNSQPTDWYFTEYAWVPYDVLGMHTSRPASDYFQLMRDEKKAIKVVASSPYWWRFESNGHRGLCRMANFNSGSGGVNGHVTATVSPDITFPAVEPHLAAVIEGLLAEKDGPGVAWIAHFRKHQNLLFLPFFEKVRSDPRLRKAVDAIARAEYDVPNAPTPDDCDRILGAILDRVETNGAFQVPSPESIAIDLMGDAATASVVRRFREESSFNTGGSGRSTSGHVVILQRSGKGARQLPLEYAVKRLQPPELFDGLVYRWARTGRDMEIVASYRNEAAIQLVANYFREAQQQGSKSHSVDMALHSASEIINPSLEQQLYQFVQNTAIGSFREFYATQFVSARIGVPGVDQKRLASWVSYGAPLKEQERLEYLLKIDAPGAASSSQVFEAARDPQKMMDVEYRLAEHPNPSFDRFLISRYWEERDERRWGNDYTARTAALLRIDTPAVRKFIGDIYQTSGMREKFLDRLVSQKKADLARLAWMTPLVEQFNDAASRTKSVRLLASFRTPEADKLLDRWAREGNEESRKAVEQQREERKKEDAERAARLRQWSDLLAGKIQPEDLVPPEKPWNWDGKQYVQEK